MTPQEISRVEEIVEEMSNYNHELPEEVRKLIQELGEIVLTIKKE